MSAVSHDKQLMEKCLRMSKDLQENTLLQKVDMYGTEDVTTFCLTAAAQDDHPFRQRALDVLAALDSPPPPPTRPAPPQ